MYESSSTQLKLEKKALDEISLENIRRHIDWFYENTGLLEWGRITGTKGEQLACTYIKKTLESYGLTVKVHRPWLFVSHSGTPPKPGNATIEIISPIKNRTIQGFTLSYSPTTPVKGLEAELIYAKAGTEKDYQFINSDSKITLVELRYPPMRQQKARNAMKYGSIGHIQIHHGILEEDALYLGGIRDEWGNPTFKTIEASYPTMPSLTITTKDGEYLKNLIKRGPVKVRLHTKNNPPKWVQAFQPVVTIKGNRNPEKFILLSAHYDGWPGGCFCNGTGISMLIELCRILAKFKAELKRSVKVVWWTGHEDYAMYAGSTWFVDQFWSNLNKNCVAYRVIDSQGIGNKILWLKVSLEIADFERDLIKELFCETPEVWPDFISIKHGDQSLLGMGVTMLHERTAFPTIQVNKSSNTKKVTTTQQAWWMHSTKDTPDRVEIEAVEKGLKLYLLSSLRLSNTLFLPLEYDTLAKKFIRTLRKYHEKSKKRFSLQSLIDQVEIFRQKAVELRKLIEKIEAEYQQIPMKCRWNQIFNSTNDYYLQLSRILTPILYTQRSRYEQDPAGNRYPIPTLQKIIELQALASVTHEFRLLETQMVREKNKISDAVNTAVETINHTIVQLRSLAT